MINNDEMIKDFAQENEDGGGERLFRGRIAIVGINKKEKHILTHVSNEPFRIKHIEFLEGKFLYVLCENNEGHQIIHIWNIEKDVLLLSIEMKNRIKMFAINPANFSQVKNYLFYIFRWSYVPHNYFDIWKLI